MWEQMPTTLKEKTTLAQAQKDWWHDPRSESSWRLSWSGLVDLVDLLNLETWEFEFEKKTVAPHILLKLSRNMTTPYYIVDNRKDARMIVLDSKTAVVINLYGNPERWISTLAY
jgi:hypothetical protein